MRAGWPSRTRGKPTVRIARSCAPGSWAAAPLTTLASCSRGAPADYDEWGHGWGYDAIKPYLQRAEREMRVRRFAPEELSPWHRAFASAAGNEAILHPVNAVGAVRWNTAFAYLDPARARDNLTILADALVDRVVLAGDRAIGVATTAGELRAQSVVLAAGAYGSPGILLRSGVGPERELPVGGGLCDHVGVGFGFEGTQRLQREAAEFERSQPLFMAQVTIAIASSVCAAGVCDLFFFPGLDPLGEHGYEASVAVFAMKPDSRGSVGLSSRDPRAPLAIDHGFLSDPRDTEVLAEGVEVLRRLTGSEAIRSYAGCERRPGAEVAAPRCTGCRGLTRARDGPGVLSPCRDMRDRARCRRRRPCLRTRRTLCRRRLDHADDSKSKHQPLHHRSGRTTRGDHRVVAVRSLRGRRCVEAKAVRRRRTRPPRTRAQAGTGGCWAR
jgi:choline dehydrogenase-like flavoprotein